MLYPNQLRKIVLKMVYEKQSGHIGGSFSIAELITYLYNTYEIDEDKNQLVLSKGHAVPIIYAVLNAIGVISNEELSTFREVNSKLQGHPVAKLMSKHIHSTTGSLGQGLSIAIGKAIAVKRLNLPFKIYCIIGDGELQEGQIWEGLMYAPQAQINNLIVFVDVNGYQGDGKLIYNKNMYLKNLVRISKDLGWESMVGNGHDMHFIEQACNIKTLKPQIIFLDTVKGKGVSFMEHNQEWHSKAPTESEYYLALSELNNE